MGAMEGGRVSLRPVEFEFHIIRYRKCFPSHSSFDCSPLSEEDFYPNSNEKAHDSLAISGTALSLFGFGRDICKLLIASCLS
jgi:hypothetical protein